MRIGGLVEDGYWIHERTRPRNCLDGPDLDSNERAISNSASSTSCTGNLRRAQAHLDALKSVVYRDDDDSHVSEKSKLKCRGRHASFPELRGGFALCLPNHVSQLGGDCPNAVCVFTQIRPLLRLVAPDLHTRVVAVKAYAIRAAYLLSICKSFEKSPRDDRRCHISLHGITEKENEPDRVLAQRARGVRKKLKCTTA
jgi:hypothetical protein